VTLRHTRRTMGLPARAAMRGPQPNRRERVELRAIVECGSDVTLVSCRGPGSEALNVNRQLWRGWSDDPEKGRENGKGNPGEMVGGL
jgi:hypothetical protein